jgi:hypothetical protein
MSPKPDLGAVFDEHMRCEFVLKDAEATMDTMTDNPFLHHVPTGIGGVGREAVLAFYRDMFIPAWPDDVRTTFSWLVPPPAPTVTTAVAHSRWRPAAKTPPSRSI